TLLCDIILGQYPGICTTVDVPSKRDPDLTGDYRLFKGSHAADIAIATANQSTRHISRHQMIADLKVVSTALSDKKQLVDRVIQALEDEEAEAAGTGEGPFHANPANETDKEGGDTEEFVE
ncbi:envelope-like protein, partial [Trifolium medium]|nr:envelope-like protein [Trifolium medium]